MPGADCGTDHELLVAIIQVEEYEKKTEIENRYTLCDIPERYAVLEVKNRFAALDLIDREPEEL